MHEGAAALGLNAADAHDNRGNTLQNLGRHADALMRMGFHTDHVHPHGWVSSAYYMAVPGGVADHPQFESWLRFGRPDLPLPGRWCSSHRCCGTARCRSAQRQNG